MSTTEPGKVGKVVIAADVHLGPDYGISSVRDVRKMVNSALFTCGGKADLFIAAGDVGEGLQNIRESLSIMSDISDERIFIPGNHDIYCLDYITSDVLLYETLPFVAEELGYQYGLQDYDHRLSAMYSLSEDVLLWASPCWHNGTFSPLGKSYGRDEIRSSYAKLRDATYTINLHYSQIHQKEMSSFLSYMQIGSRLERAKLILIVSHYPIFSCLYKEDHRSKDDVMNAFFYSPEFGEEVLRMAAMYPDKRFLCVCGHTHRGGDERPAPNVRAIMIRSNYKEPGYIVIEPEVYLHSETSGAYKM